MLRNRKLSLIGLVPGILFGSLHAGSARADAPHCSLRSDADERRACYAASAQTTPTKSRKDWFVALSKAADSVSVIRSAREEVMCADTVGSITLGLTCREKRSSVLLSAGCPLGETGDEINVPLRIDGGDPLIETFKIPRNTRALNQDGEDAAIRIMKALLGAESLEVAVTPPAHPQFTASFDISGLDQKIKPLREACGW